MELVQRATIESSVKEIAALPVSWFVRRLKDQTLYMLDLKKTGIVSISNQVAIHFTPDRVGSGNQATEQRRKSELSKEEFWDPELILKIDLTLNGITDVTVNDLAVFPELRSLDLSLNAIHKFQGIGVSTRLVYLNLSYNNISETPNEALAECISLQTLNLSVNKLSTLTGFPNLLNLIKLNVRSNKLQDLQGLQVLRSLRQLDASQNKLVDVVHICPCLELTELKLSNNKIRNVSDTVAALSPLSRLKQLFLNGNPMLESLTDIELQSIFTKETTVELLDGTNIRPAKIQFKHFSHLQPPDAKNDLKIQLKDAVKESMAEAREKKRQETRDRVEFLQKKILTLLDEMEESEVTSLSDTEAWCRYIDTLTMNETKSLTVSQIRAAAIAEPDGYLPLEGSVYGLPTSAARIPD